MFAELSIKNKLLFYGVFIQAGILLLFGYSLYKTLQISTTERLQSSLKVIALDIYDDMHEHVSLQNMG